MHARFGKNPGGILWGANPYFARPGCLGTSEKAGGRARQRAIARQADAAHRRGRAHPLESGREPPETLFRSYELRTGDRVLVTAQLLRGHTGTLIRRTRLPWNLQKAWIVELDAAKPPGGKRQPIGEWVLVPLAPETEPPPGSPAP